MLYLQSLGLSETRVTSTTTYCSDICYYLMSDINTDIAFKIFIIFNLAVYKLAILQMDYFTTSSIRFIKRVAFLHRVKGSSGI